MSTEMAEMYSIAQGELTAITQSLAVGMEILDDLAASAQVLSEAAAGCPSSATPVIPAKTKIIIYSDSMDVQHRLSSGINCDPSDAMPPAKGSGRANFYFAHTLPGVRATIWYSHELKGRDSEIEIRWLPRRTTVPARIADDLAGQWKTMGEEYWQEEEYEALHGQTSWHIVDRLRPEVREAVGAFNLSSVVDLAPSMRSHDDSQTPNLSRGSRRRRGRAQAGNDKAYRRNSKADYRRRNDAQS
ncbi:hypothetical protein V8F06_012573 [Rhypophila decipiens]